MDLNYNDLPVKVCLKPYRASYMVTVVTDQMKEHLKLKIGKKISNTAFFSLTSLDVCTHFSDSVYFLLQ